MLSISVCFVSSGGLHTVCALVTGVQSCALPIFIFRQFSVTIVSSMALSVIVALVLTSALCATILKPHDPRQGQGQGPLARFFRWFNDKFDREIGRAH